MIKTLRADGSSQKNMNNITVSSSTLETDVDDNTYVVNTGAGSIVLGSSAIAGAASVWNWNSPSSITGSNGISVSDWNTVGTHSTLQVHGDAEFKGDIKIKGISLGDTLEKINQRLAILTPNSELESRWNDLRELRERYQQLEAEILEKEEIIRILKR